MIQSFAEFAKSFFDFAGKRVFVAYALVFSATVLEGVGLVMLVPVIELFANQEPSRFSVWVRDILLSLNITSKESQLSLALVGFLFLLALRNLLSWLRETRIRRLSQGFVDNWRSRVFSSMAHAPWQRVIKHQRTDLEHAINSDVSRLSVGTDQILRGSIVIVMMVVQTVIAFLLSAQLTTIVILFIGGAGVLLLPTLRRAQELGKIATKTGRRSHKVLGQFMSGLKLAKAHGTENTYMARFDGAISESRKYSLTFQSQQAAYRAVFQFVSGVVVCFIIVVGLFYLETPVPTLIVVLIIMGRLTSPFLSLVQSAQSIANMLPAFDSLRQKVADLSPDNTGAGVGCDAFTSSQSSRSAAAMKVTFDDVHFQYDDAHEPVLKGISFEIEPGSMTAILGASGAGKTTIVDLMCGLLSPSCGEVVFSDGEKTSHPEDVRWKQEVAYVPQDPFLFDATVKENLLWPKPETESSVSDELIWGVLRLVGAEEFVANSPKQLQSRAGERGQSFSGGERQRLCLARALVRKPRLLILDEATNAVDMKLEEDLLARLHKIRGETTIVVITHRHSSVVNADHVLKLKNGQLVD